jgi:small subunit ribosomal protein S15
MARMHSRKKGKAGSKRPVDKKIASWVRYKDKEVEMLITKLAKEGNSPSQIGLVLRDTYGIPYVKGLAGKTITKILGEKKLLSKLPEDLLALIKKSIKLRKHIESNHKDESSRRGLLLTESKIKRLIKYYKRTGKLAEDWKYHPDRVRMYLE